MHQLQLRGVRAEAFLYARLKQSRSSLDISRQAALSQPFATVPPPSPRELARGAADRVLRVLRAVPEERRRPLEPAARAAFTPRSPRGRVEESTVFCRVHTSRKSIMYRSAGANWLELENARVFANSTTRRLLAAALALLDGGPDRGAAGSVLSGRRSYVAVLLSDPLGEQVRSAEDARAALARCNIEPGRLARSSRGVVVDGPS